jgi:predicted RNase H-like HicB family nuclease
MKEEALANAKETILCHIEGLRKAGERYRARSVHSGTSKDRHLNFRKE